jgi:hypothetical protein
MDITELKRNRTNKRHPWEKVRAKIIHEFIKKNYFSRSHLLDVGSGDAFVVDYLCNSGISNHYTAVDVAYTKETIETINRKTSCKIDFLQKVPEVLNPKADCILLLDVLEHCKDDSELLTQLTSPSLTQLPILIITVPAFQKLFSKHDKLLLHYRRYTVSGLKALCKKNKIEVLSSGYFFSSLLLIRCIQLFLEKLSFYKPVKSIDNWNGSAITSSLISLCLWIDFLTGRFFSFIGIQIPGLSAYCICRPLPS